VLYAPAVKPSSTGGIVGTNTADDVDAGGIGEYILAADSAVSFPATTTFGDLESISLTPGDWDIDAIVVANANGATVDTWSVGVSTTAGDFTIGLVLGDSRANGLPPIATSDSSLSISGLRASISSTTTYYLKFSGTFTVATPQASGRISARRRR